MDWRRVYGVMKKREAIFWRKLFRGRARLAGILGKNIPERKELLARVTPCVVGVSKYILGRE